MKVFAQKVGMTQVYSPEGVHTPVTVLKLSKTVVCGQRDLQKDGLEAMIIARQDKKSNVKKSIAGQFKGVENIRKVVEDKGLVGTDKKIKDTIEAGDFSQGDILLVVGTSKGKGFSGTVKRHGFNTGPKTHGSCNYRRPGSIGPTYPQRVIKGRKMAGKMGAKRVSIKEVQVIKVLAETQALWVKGPVPGPVKGNVILEK